MKESLVTRRQRERERERGRQSLYVGSARTHQFNFSTQLRNTNGFVLLLSRLSICIYRQVRLNLRMLIYLFSPLSSRGANFGPVGAYKIFDN